jgi:hypothetical protein
LDQGVEQIDAVFGGGGEVGTQVAEVFGAGEGAHGAGDLLPDFDHADFAFGGVVVERASPWVVSETQVVIYAFEHPADQRMQLFADRGELTGVVLDPDQSGVSERGDTGGENVRREQLRNQIRASVVVRRNARGGRSAVENFVSAVRCLYRRAVADGLIRETDNPAAKVAKPRRLPGEQPHSLQGEGFPRAAVRSP